MIRADIIKAAQAALAGGVVCYPTEGVFGLGCLPHEFEAVQRILDFKGRNAANGVILIGANLPQLLPWIAPSAEELQHLMSDTDTPTTWIMTASPIAPDWITGGRNTVAVRLCSHPVAAALCNACDSALVSTSANRSGHRPADNTIAARLWTKPVADAVVSGTPFAGQGPSKIIDARNGTVIR